MARWRLIRKPRAAAQLPIASLRSERSPHFARPPGIEGQRAPHLDIGQLDRRGRRTLRARRGGGHFDHRRGGQHRHAFDGMIGKPGQRLRIEMIDPAANRPRLPVAEQRMLEWRVAEPEVFDRMLEPEPLALPRVKRQLARVSGPIEPRRPCDVVAGNMALRRQRRKRVSVRLLPAQRPQRPPLSLGGAQSIVQVSLQNRVRSDLDKDPKAVLHQRRGCVGEAHRRADVVPPIFGVELAGAHRLAGHCREQPRAWRGGGEPVEIGEQPVAYRIHRRGVKCKVEIERAERDPATPRLGPKPLNRVARTGDRNGMGRIDRAEFQRAADLIEQFAGCAAAQSERRHASVTAGPLLVAATRDDNTRGVRQRQRSGSPGGGDFADAVTDMRFRLDAEATQDRHDAELDREQQRLRDIGMHQPVRLDAVFDQLGDRPAETRPQRGIGLVDSRAKRRAGAIGAARHFRPLRAVAGENKGELRFAQRGSANHGVLVAGGERVELRSRFHRIGAEHNEAVRVMVTATRSSPQQRTRPFGCDARERLLPAPRQVAQRRLAARRDDERRHRSDRRLSPRGLLRRRRQYRMAVGAAKTKGVDAGALAAGERFGVAHDAQIELVERDLWVRRHAMQARRQRAMFERERRLDQPGHARCGFEVSDIRFDRTDRQRFRPELAQRMPDRGRLDRIAGRRPGAVHLEKGEIIRHSRGALADRADQRRLRRLAWHREANRAPVGIDAGTADDRADRIAVGQRVLQPLQHDDSAAFTADIAVRPLVKREAAAAARQHRGAGEAEKRIGREQQVDPADDRAGDALLAQGLARLVQCDERGRAGRVDRQARPVQVEHIGNPIGENAERPAGHEIGIAGCRIAQPQIAIVGRRAADIDPGRAPGDFAGRNAGVFECVPDEFEEQPLLRIHLRGLARRDPEKCRFKQIDAGQQPGRPGIALAALVLVRVVIKARRPPRLVDLGDGIRAGDEQLPERLQIGRAGESAGGADDRDQLVTHGLEANPLPFMRDLLGRAGRATLPSLHIPPPKGQFRGCAGR